MNRRISRVFVIAALAAGLASPATAAAGFFPGEPIDGPSADIVRFGDLDVARDGSGALAYVKRDGGAEHIFVSRLDRGTWTAPLRIDGDLGSPGAQPVVAAADGGRVVVAFTSGGSLFAVSRAAGAGGGIGGSGFASPTLVAASASNPSIDMSINGAAYVSFTSPGGSAADVRVARLERDQSQFTVLAETLDLDPGRDAGDGAKRSRVAISADGTGLVVWGESGADGRSHVIARRVFGMRISTAPQDLTLDEFDGRAGRDADSPELDIEDDSSFAWVAFRQAFQDGLTQTTRTIARRLVGSQFEAPSSVDGGEASGAPRVELNGRGEGLITAAGSAFGAIGTPVHDDRIFPSVRLDGGNAVAPAAVPAFPENSDGLVAWLQGSPAGAVVRARPWNLDPAKRVVAAPGAEAGLSDDALGPVDPDGGFDVASNRAGDVVAVFVQGTGGDRRLMSGGFDRPPGAFRIYTTSKYRSFARTPLAWSPSFELWGPVSYSAEVDGVSIGSTTQTSLVPANPVPDGVHKVRIVATDRRGQTAITRTSTLRVDSTAPVVDFKIKGTRKAGRALKISFTASDVTTSTGASGLRFVRVDFGDRTPVMRAARFRGTLTHRFARGRFFIRVSATDRAGNAVAVVRQIRIKKK